MVRFVSAGKASTVHQIALDAFAEEKEKGLPPLPTAAPRPLSPGRSIYGKVPITGDAPKKISPTQLAGAIAESSPTTTSSAPTTSTPGRRKKSRFAPIEDEHSDSTQDKSVTSSSVDAEHARSVDDDLFDTALFAGKEQPESSGIAHEKLEEGTSSQETSPKLPKVKPQGPSPPKTQYQAYKAYEDSKDDEDSKESKEDDNESQTRRRSRRLRNQDKDKPDDAKSKEPEKKKRGRGRPRKEKVEETPSSPPSPTDDQQPDLVNIVQDSTPTTDSQKHKEFAIPDSVPTRDLAEFGSPSSRPEKVKSRYVCSLFSRDVSCTFAYFIGVCVSTDLTES